MIHLGEDGTEELEKLPKQHLVWYDILDEAQIAQAKELYFGQGVFYKQPPSPIDFLVKLAAEDVPEINDAVGIEVWSNNIAVDYHLDKDELLDDMTGELKFPICSIVYYLTIKNLYRGRLYFEKETVTPVENSIVIFGPGIPHGVEPYRGERVAISINPWKEVPLKYVENMG